MYELSEENCRPDPDSANHIGLYETELFLLKYVAHHGRFNCKDAEREWSEVNPFGLGGKDTSDFLIEKGYLSTDGELEPKGKIELMLEHWPTTGELLGISLPHSTKNYIQIHDALRHGGYSEELWHSFLAKEIF
jgi:hypothetical protein